MSEHQPADSQDTHAEVQVYAVGDRWWSWRYVERGTDVELHSNDTFSSREAAVDSAQRAYPDLEVSEAED